MKNSNYSEVAELQPKKGRLHYTTVWRWHFYAGLFCIPFILWLSCTGLIYLFKPQIDVYINQPYDHLTIQQVQPASKQVQMALNAVQNSVFSAYELPPNTQAASRIYVAKHDQIYKVFVNPDNLKVLKVINQNDEFTRQIFLLHGELMLGNNGSNIIQIAASWTVVMVITGIFLWLGKGGKLQFAGMVYPRLNRSGRSFWKEIHSVIGFWISAIVLFLIVSGLPWSSSWGGMLKQIREWHAQTEIQQDWTTSSKEEAKQHQHLYHQTMKMQQSAAHHGQMMAVHLDQAQNMILDKIVLEAPKFALAYPVQIKPEIHDMNQSWSIESQAQNRILREKITFDENGQVLRHKTFAMQALLDRIIAYGVAIHEGRLFGLLNVLIGLVTVISLIIICVSGIIMWLKRKPTEVLGAPPIVLSQTLSWAVKMAMIVLGILLPLLGLSLIFVLLLERFVLSKIPNVAEFLGLKLN